MGVVLGWSAARLTIGPLVELAEHNWRGGLLHYPPIFRGGVGLDGGISDVELWKDGDMYAGSQWI